ncbi:MAG: Holliday junction resolvase-like protein [Dehalogenimonas sp.]|uniref:Holliday junction resolvase-like protein n=1 Tax=Candidatus Dehalogenimonas loeffleri TaxID=3127115 RepID=A0ABZ2J3T7_9CHLR|nr:Holliday junction resolvase-like protein [Dehalogenimonas sp.]
MDTPLIIVLATVAAFLIITVNYYLIKWRFEVRFRDWQRQEQEYWQSEVSRVSKQAVNQSRAVLGGRFTEQMAPYLPEFRYDPTEARFIGSPIDLVVFPGLAAGDPREIVIMEIKSGQNPQLTPAQKRIRQLIEDGMVRWELIERRCEAEPDPELE